MTLSRSKIKKFLYKLLYEIPTFFKKRFYIRYNRVKFMIGGVHYGKCMVIHNKVSLSIPAGQITIGDNFTCISGGHLNPLSRNMESSFYCNGGCIYIGNNVGISSACLWSMNQIQIGNNVKIGANTMIIDNDAHSQDYNNRRITYEDQSNIRNSAIVIGDDVLIGANTTILKGVSIGARTIIGAGSVVTKDIPQDCIAAGNPCEVVRQL